MVSRKLSFPELRRQRSEHLSYVTGLNKTVKALHVPVYDYKFFTYLHITYKQLTATFMENTLRKTFQMKLNLFKKHFITQFVATPLKREYCISCMIIIIILLLLLHKTLT